MMKPASVATIVQNRNDRCACGSGKKFKNCCGIKQDVSPVHEHQDTLLREVLQTFFTSQPVPSEQQNLMSWKDVAEDYLVPLYGEEKANSVIGDLFFFGERVDIWNGYLKTKTTEAKYADIQAILAAWQDPELVAGLVTEIQKHRATVKALLSGSVYEVDVNESFPASENDLVLGFMVPDLREVDTYRMVLNSVITASGQTEAIQEALAKRFEQVRGNSPQKYLLQHALEVYQLFKAEPTTENPKEQAIRDLEQRLVDADIRNEEILELLYHALQSVEIVPEYAIDSALQFGLEKGWFTYERLLLHPLSSDAQNFVKDLHRLYDQTMAHQEKEATYAFEVGTDPKGTELSNWELFKHLESLEITNEQVLQRQMDFYGGKPFTAGTIEDKAQRLAYLTFREELTPNKVARIHALYPSLADGYILESHLESEPEKREKLLQQALETGRSTFEQEMDVAWMYVPNRPYLRALFTAGTFYFEQRNFMEAFTQFYTLLQLNPGDHQGARYLAVACLIAQKQYEDAESLMKHYEVAHTDNANYAWFRWLIAYNTERFSARTQQLYEQALEQNPYVKKYVVGKLPSVAFPRKLRVVPRSPEEAQLIWTYIEPSLT